jgi:HK97 gp10 family phage protein
MSVGDQVADRAAQSADVWSDEGFASIHAEAVKDGDEWTARVSWDEQHFYLLFSEVGTSKMPARPFLRPALEGDYTP